MHSINKESEHNMIDEVSKRDVFLSKMPKYNPNPAIMFNHAGEIVFQNEASKNLFPDIKELGDFYTMSKIELISLISKDETITMEYEKSGKYYQLTFKGVSEITSVLVYATDITDTISTFKALEKIQKQFIFAMGAIGESRSRETGNHVKRVASYSKLLALLVGMDEAEAELLRLASPMHDIGKVAISDTILNKPSRLTKEEFDTMKEHTTYGYEMFLGYEQPIFKTAAIVAHEHHEKYDGSGYPQGLKGEDIHIYGRITALADVFDALGSDRVYKKAWKLEKILELIEYESGKHFDPKLVTLFLENLDQFLEIKDKYKDVI
jgi:response regulator RpfG family c-di-GMP phosphodiesterase